MLRFNIPLPDEGVRQTINKFASSKSDFKGYKKEQGLNVMSAGWMQSAPAQDMMIRFINHCLTTYPGLVYEVRKLLIELAGVEGSESRYAVSKDALLNRKDDLAVEAGFNDKLGMAMNLNKFDPILRMAVTRWLITNRGSRTLLSDDVLAGLLVREVGGKANEETGTVDILTSSDNLCHMDSDLDTESGIDFAVGLGQTHYLLASGVAEDVGLSHLTDVLAWAHGFWPWHLQVLWEQVCLTRWARSYGKLITNGPKPQWFAKPDLIYDSAFTSAYYWYYYMGQPAVIRGKVETVRSKMYSGTNSNSTPESQMTKSGKVVWNVYDRGPYASYTEYLMIGPIVGAKVGYSDAVLQRQQIKAEDIISAILVDVPDRIQPPSDITVSKLKTFMLHNFNSFRLSSNSSLTNLSAGFKAQSIGIPATFKIEYTPWF